MSIFTDLYEDVKAEVIEAGQNSYNDFKTVSAAKINDFLGVETPAAPKIVSAPPSVPLTPATAPAAAPAAPAADDGLKSRLTMYGIVAAVIIFLLFRK